MASMLVTAARGLLCLHILVIGAATGAEDPHKVPDPTPPPLGTASFVPPANLDEQPLNSQSFVVQAALINMADEVDARMIVVGSYGDSPLKGAILGSTPHKLVHLSKRPVLVVHGEEED